MGAASGPLNCDRRKNPSFSTVSARSGPTPRSRASLRLGDLGHLRRRREAFEHRREDAVGFGAAGMGRVAPQQHNARGIRSPAYEPGPDSEVHEGAAVRLSIGARASSSPGSPNAESRRFAASLDEVQHVHILVIGFNLPSDFSAKAEPNRHDNAMSYLMF